MVGQVVSLFDLSRTLLVGGGLLVPCSLQGPPVIKQLMQMVTIVRRVYAPQFLSRHNEDLERRYGAWPGWAVSISVLPLT